tara:strand:- start:2584 stop:2889 length:306 start_codon:yes stop_codon:yes gene_type:complete
MTYRPLPVCLTIQPSKVDGLGLFTLCDLEKGVNLGVSHIQVDLQQYPHVEEIVRTPLGGFINHSETPNLKKVKDRKLYFIYTVVDIPMGSELYLKYEWYST